MGRHRQGHWARHRAAVAAAVLLVGLTGCGRDSTEQAGDPAARRNAVGVGSSPAPTGTFLSTEVTEDGEPRPLVRGTRVSVRFDEGQVSANAGCNTMSGPARFEGGTLVITGLAMTDMGCPGDGRQEQDQFVAGFLTAAPAYTFAGRTLTLSTPGVRMVFGPREQVQPDLPLQGTTWNATHVVQGPARGAADDPDAAVSAAVAPPTAYLEFADGKVSGSDGCNRISGPATVSGDVITFGPIASTRMACPGVDGTEAVYAVLTGDVSWRIEHTVLTLTSASGAGLQLQAQEVTPPCCKPAAPAEPAPAVAPNY